LTPIPSYGELAQRTDAPPRSSWGLFGDLGTIARLTPERVRDAVRVVQTGEVFDLDWSLDAFQPPTGGTRSLPQHHLFQKRPTHRDDYVDSLYLQASTHIDGLRHQAHDEYGFYNGTDPDEFVAGGGPLGVERWARHGIVGRGVLVDIDRFLIETRGHGLDHRAGEAFGIDLLDAAARTQGVEVREGDILLLHTGWCQYYIEDLTKEEREALRGALVCSGLAQSEAALAWLWDHGVALVAADNPAVEVVPSIPNPDFLGVSPDGRIHPAAIAMLGLPFGELWRLDELADACAADGRREMLVVVSPLRLPGAVGSPANALAIR
jgi:kynurenine formamidase